MGKILIMLSKTKNGFGFEMQIIDRNKGDLKLQHLTMHTCFLT